MMADMLTLETLCGSFIGFMLSIWNFSSFTVSFEQFVGFFVRGRRCTISVSGRWPGVEVSLSYS